MPRLPDGQYHMVARTSSDRLDSDMEAAIQASLLAEEGVDDSDREAAMQASLRVDDGLQLMRTPSVQQDLETGMDETRAALGQAMRAELRLVDAELVGLRHELARSRLLRGPSGERVQCDADCIVGGCQLDKAVEDGILCPGCELFLCHECFGSLNVANECSIGGRYDRTISSPSSQPSEPGSLPCPMFPSGCDVGHIPLVDIQRALLHPKNRGRDGEYEDIDSPGHSPHKLHLLARRRAAERDLASRAGSPALTAQSKLIRTITEVRRSRAVEIIGVANQSDLRVLLAERNSEMDELRKALQLFPPDAQIAPQDRRTCAQCGGVFHATIEGGQCSIQKPHHFLCNLCFGSYLMHACSVDGSYDQVITDNADQSLVLSDRGQVPCPLFRGHVRSGVHEWTMESAALTCHCGDIGTSVIERVLLDPRNRSAEFYRELNPAGVIRSLEHTLNGSFEPQLWSRETELLGRGACPVNVWESARHRLAEQTATAAIDQANTSAQNLEAGLEGSDAAAIERARQKLVDALDSAGTLRCPRCGVRAHKDDACIHMDSCDCGSRWCFLCNKESGDGPGQCPRGPGKGGCDEQAMFLQNCPGWDNFAIGNETPGMGAQQEFLRRRMAFSARAVKSETPEDVWQQLREKHSDLLENVPTPGRSIDWDAIDTAEMPTFSSNSSGGGTAAQRFQQEWAAMRAQEAAHELRQRNRFIRDAHRTILPAVIVAFVVVLLLVDSSIVMRVSPPPSPVVALNATSICNSVDELFVYEAKVKDSEGIENCVGDTDDEEQHARQQACVQTAVCLFCKGSIANHSNSTLPDGMLCLYDRPTPTSQLNAPKNTIKLPYMYSILSTLPLVEIGWRSLEWIAAVWAWRAAAQPRAEERRRELEHFIVLAPILCVIFYWQNEEVDDMLSQNAIVNMILAPTSFMLGNLFCGALFLLFVCPNLGLPDGGATCLWAFAGLHVVNTCCLGSFYYVIAIIFQLRNWGYESWDHTADDEAMAVDDPSMQENMVLSLSLSVSLSLSLSLCLSVSLSLLEGGLSFYAGEHGAPLRVVRDDTVSCDHRHGSVLFKLCCCGRTGDRCRSRVGGKAHSAMYIRSFKSEPSSSASYDMRV